MISLYKTLSFSFAFLIAILPGSKNSVYAQTETANVVIDSVNVVFKGNLSFPYWLKAGQTLNVGPNTASISVLEFMIDTANGNNLKFSQTLSIKSSSKVPAARTWKIESVAFLDNAIVGTKPAALVSPANFSNPGTYTWTVPEGVGRVCIEVWGGGGRGANGDWNSGGGGGGGGGGYGYGCFSMQPGSSHTVVVGGSSGTSSFDGTLIFATGGSNGTVTAGGNGGTSNGRLLVMNGANGSQGNPIPYPGWFGSVGGGPGGSGANGGSGGIGGNGSNNPPSGSGGAFGGGGGGGGANNNTRVNFGGASGASGLVKIHW